MMLCGIDLRFNLLGRQIGVTYRLSWCFIISSISSSSSSFLRLNEAACCIGGYSINNCAAAATVCWNCTKAPKVLPFEF